MKPQNPRNIPFNMATVFSTIKETVNILSIFIFGIYSYINLIVRFVVPPQLKSLDGEIFLITGAGSGIGREVAKQLARDHPKTILVLWDVNGEQNEKTAQDARESGSKVFAYKVDVADRLQVYKTAKKVGEEVGNVTILFNNAGIAATKYLLDNKSKDEDLEKTIQVNLISHFWTLKAFLPSMVSNNHGHIVTTGSLGSYFGHKACLPYYATKFAIRGYLESLEDELRSHSNLTDGIVFTTVFPGFVETALTEKITTRVGIGKAKGMLPVDLVGQKIIEGVCQNQEKIFIPKIAELGVLAKSVMPKKLFLKIQNYFVSNK